MSLSCWVEPDGELLDAVDLLAGLAVEQVEVEVVGSDLGRLDDHLESHRRRGRAPLRPARLPPLPVARRVSSTAVAASTSTASAISMLIRRRRVADGPPPCAKRAVAASRTHRHGDDHRDEHELREQRDRVGAGQDLGERRRGRSSPAGSRRRRAASIAGSAIRENKAVAVEPRSGRAIRAAWPVHGELAPPGRRARCRRRAHGRGR